MLLLAAASVAFAAPQMEVSANRNELYLGESIQLQIKIADAPDGAEPDLSAIKGASVQALGSRKVSNFQLSIVNGQVHREGFSGTIFAYTIVPQAPGEFRAGPIRLHAAGKDLEDPGPVIRVTDIQKQDLVKVELLASRETVLADEPFDLTVRVLIRRMDGDLADIDPMLPNAPPTLQADFLDGNPIPGLTVPDVRQNLSNRLIRDRRRPGIAINNYTIERDPFDFGNAFDMEDFMRPQTARFSLDRTEASDGGRSYYIYSITLSYQSQEEGDYTLGPAVFKGNVITDVDRAGQARTAQIFAVGPARTVRVLPPPETNRPPLYVGAVGTNMLAESALDSQTCKVGDPLKLTVSVWGDVRLRNSFPPKLGQYPELAKLFQVYDDNVQTVKKDNRRDYTYTLRPLRAGTYELPGLPIAYYDIAARTYRIAATKPIPVQAAEAREVTAAQVISDTTNASLAMPAEQRRAATAPAALRIAADGAASAPLGPASGWIALAGAGPVVWLAVAVVLWLRDRSPARRKLRRRAQALARAEAALHKMEQTTQANPGAAGHAACESLRAFLADLLDVPSAGIAPEDARRALEQHGCSARTANDFAALMEQHFNAAFANQPAPAQAPRHADVTALLKAVREEIEKHHASLLKKSRKEDARP